MKKSCTVDGFRANETDAVVVPSGNFSN
jgi:hypothetical protein